MDIFLKYAPHLSKSALKGYGSGNTASPMHGRGHLLKLLDLPCEILMQILTPFSTHALLPLTLTCKEVHNLVLRILHYRLLLAAAAPEYKIILEAYHPARRYTRPYLYCEYLGTDGLTAELDGEESLYNDCDGVSGRLGKLGALYSRFRPEHPGVEGTIPARRIAGATPILAQPTDGTGATASEGWSQSTSLTTPIYLNAGDGGKRKVIHTINLDGGELFGQFCTYGSLVQLSERRGVFLSTVNIVQPGQGTIRVWRNWLVDRCRELYEAERDGMELDCASVAKDSTILWTDYHKNVGVKVAVRHRNLMHNEMNDLDEETLSCDLEIQELVVRTTHLTLAVEDSIAAKADAGRGKALIFGSFASRAA
ncbi:hypothetical protein LTS08_001545 [Lithohypha guttulata]|uniref:uncharacterized protein n=1 Tax=Lithohypha guttulata TaxID=1690604 RepID=UPI002DDF0014|nr:hypothetical protein LTR51_003788 [Lithohypha guttulata]KAK5105270.1 hypothetical protein LTS08_001545 [Lithohypha guttulata]